MSHIEDVRWDMLDELAMQARALLQIARNETDEQRASRLGSYRRLLGQYGADTTGDEAHLIARLGHLVGMTRGVRPDAI